MFDHPTDNISPPGFFRDLRGMAAWALASTIFAVGLYHVISFFGWLAWGLVTL